MPQICNLRDLHHVGQRNWTLTLHQDGRPGRRQRFLHRLREITHDESGKVVLTSWLAQAWRWRLRISGGLGVAVALWYFGLPVVVGPVVAVEPVVRVELVQSVVASGHVEAEFRVNVGSQIIGVVKDVPVAEGQTVKGGDVLVVLDDREARAAVGQAEGVVAQAVARLRQLREITLPSAQEALKQVRATLTNAEQSFDRAAKLAVDGFATRAALGEAQKSLDIARAQVRSAELQVFTSRLGGSDYVTVETQLNQARASLAATQSRLSYTIITAPRDGILISRAVERGNVVQPSNVLMTLSPAGATLLVVQIDEKNLGLLAIGQGALASSDAFPKETFPARIVYINPGIDLQRASVEVKLLAPSPPTYLRQDMTVSVDIEVARRPGALVVPAASIVDPAGANASVLKVSGGRAARQAVKVGLTSAGKAEIINGLDAGDLVVSAPGGLKDGARIRAQSATARAP